MKQEIYSLLIPFLSGSSTLLGYLPIYLPKKYQNTIIQKSLSFSAGIMITISLFSLIPESLKYLTKRINFLSIIIILILFVLGIIISQETNKIIEKKIPNNSLYRIGIVSIIVLILHNIPEGITTYLTTTNNIKLGISLAIAIAMHNIPEGIAIAIPIYYSTKNHKKAFIYTFISGFSELLGAILSYLFLSKYITKYLMTIILSITAGIMIHISITDLLKEALSFPNKKETIKEMFLGILLMLIIIFIFKQ